MTPTGDEHGAAHGDESGHWHQGEHDDEHHELRWERTGSHLHDDLRLFRTRIDQMRHPRSGHTFDRLVLESVDWVNAVVITEDGRHVMVRQYRFGAGQVTLETPGGMVDEGEDHLTAIRRETLEETGYGGGDWTYLGATQPNPAVFDNLCHHWVGRGVVLEGAPQPGAGEHIRVELHRAEEVIAAARRGEIRHALALAVIGRVLDLWDHLR
jgi:8-oxo-dGTP pyrophosphatase MutT (NUDIX family)